MNMMTGAVIGGLIGNAAKASGPSVASIEAENVSIRAETVAINNRTLQHSLQTQKDITGMWQRTTHNLRAKLNARVEADAVLLAQLAEANAELAQISGIPDLQFDLPLATPEGLEALATEKYEELFVDEKIIKLTFNDGRLPKESKDSFAQAEKGSPVNWTK
jgi:hypothetical protein